MLLCTSHVLILKDGKEVVLGEISYEFSMKKNSKYSACVEVFTIETLLLKQSCSRRVEKEDFLKLVCLAVIAEEGKPVSCAMNGSILGHFDDHL